MPDPRRPRVSVVVCTYTEARLPLLRELARSLEAATRRPDELIVVVDRNPELLATLTTETDPRARDLDGSPWGVRTRVLASEGSGLSAARNTGWRAARTGWVAFIDDDAVAGVDWLDELVPAAIQHDADIVGGHIEPGWPAGSPDWYTPRLGWVVGCSYEGQPHEAARVRNVIGCNMLIRRSLLKSLGGFDESLGRMAGGLAGCEETELCIRANEAGATVISIPGASVRQILPPERATLGYALRRAWGEGRSKAVLRRLHAGSRDVLDPESTYARALLAEAGRRSLAALRRWDGPEAIRAIALLGVLGATAAAYVRYGGLAPEPAGASGALGQGRRPDAGADGPLTQAQRTTGDPREPAKRRPIAVNRST